jgi:hypothetical protein
VTRKELETGESERRRLVELYKADGVNEELLFQKNGPGGEQPKERKRQIPVPSAGRQILR